MMSLQLLFFTPQFRAVTLGEMGWDGGTQDEEEEETGH